MHRTGSGRIILLIALAALWWGCEKNIPEPNAHEPRSLNAEEKALVDHSNRFAFSFLNRLHEANPHQDLFFSPLGIGMSLGMVYNGIDGSVKTRIDSMMNFNGSAMQVNKTFNELSALIRSIDDNVIISFGNSFWYNREYTLNDRFKDRIMAYYGAEAEGLNFQSSHTPDYIRRLVNNQVARRFENLDLPIPSLCQALLINATGFTGKWAAPVSELIVGIPFNGRKNSRLFELSRDAMVGYYEDDVIRVVDIPYGNNRFSMTVVMSLSPEHFPLSGVDSDALSDYLRLCETHKADLALPQIGSGYRTDLKKLFQSYHIALIPEKQDAESFMFHEPAPGKIDEAIHESYIAPFYDINEVSKVDFNASLLDSDHLILIDRSFVYFIREKHTGIILFAGKFLTPGN